MVVGVKPYFLEGVEPDSWTIDGISQYSDPCFEQGVISQFISISEVCYQNTFDQIVHVSQAFRQARIYISTASCQRNRSRDHDPLKPSLSISTELFINFSQA